MTLTTIGRVPITGRQTALESCLIAAVRETGKLIFLFLRDLNVFLPCYTLESWHHHR